MSDVVVTCPKWFWKDWIAEGDAVGEPPTGEEWIFFLSGSKPNIKPGERVYIVAHGLIRGYSPLIRWSDNPPGLIRGANAVATTILENVRGFQGFRYRWWDYSVEHPFPDWKTCNVPPNCANLWQTV